MRLKADVDFIEQQWRESAFEIKANILAQCQVICPEADFGEVGLDKHVVDGRIEVSPISEDDGDNPGDEPTTLAADPQGWASFSFFFCNRIFPVSGFINGSNF